jgi:uncharacterized protein
MLGSLTTYHLLYGACGEHPTTPGDFGLSWEDVQFKSHESGDFRAYFIHGTNGATIILPPTTNGGRGTRLDEAALLAQHGYAVLIFESRRCAAQKGPLSLGYKEALDVGDALKYLHSRADVDPARIGIIGFSSAGASAVLAAAQYPEIRAVVAEGGYGDFAEGAVGIQHNDTNVLGTIYKWSIGVTYRLITGLDIDQLSPIDVIGQIAPRPILLIYGSRESTLDDARRQLAAAGDNAQLWVVEGAGHGDYRQVAPEEFEKRVILFFDNALLDKGNPQ